MDRIEARYELRRVQQGFALRQTDLGLDDLDGEILAAKQTGDPIPNRCGALVWIHRPTLHQRRAVVNVDRSRTALRTTVCRGVPS